MKRYVPLLFISFFIVSIVIAGTSILAGYAGKQRPENIRTLTVYTSLPVEQVSLLSSEYERAFNIRVNIMPMPPAELLARLAAEKSKPRADLILADAAVLREAKRLDLVAPYTSEQTDLIPDRFKDKEGYWYGLWYDVFVFAVNQDYLKTLPDQPLKWMDLTKLKPRLAITDFLAADAAAHLLFTLVSNQGEEQTLDFLYKLHPQIIQYSKFLATPVRISGMGEADIAIAVRSEAFRYLNDGFPIKIAYPEDGTAFILTGAAISKEAPSEAKAFVDWLLSENAQTILARSKFHFVSTNPETTSAKSFTQHNIKLLEVNESLTLDQRRKILDRWVQSVRLAPR